MHVACARHDRISAIAALTLSPKRRRVGMYFHLLVDNFKGPAIASFVRKVRRALGRDLYVVWDRLNAHRTAERLVADLGDGVLFEYLPGYAPELNPVEQIWAHSKHAELANAVYEDTVDMLDRVFESLQSKQRKRELLTNFFRHARLSA